MHLMIDGVNDSAFWFILTANCSCNTVQHRDEKETHRFRDLKIQNNPLQLFVSFWEPPPHLTSTVHLEPVCMASRLWTLRPTLRYLPKSEAMRGVVLNNSEPL